MITDHERKSDLFEAFEQEFKRAFMPTGPTVCPKCGETILADHAFKIINNVGDYGEPLSSHIEHKNCKDPLSPVNVPMEANETKSGLRQSLQTEKMKDGPSMEPLDPNEKLRK